MSQDPSDSAPGSDPTAASAPDSAYAPPPSWSATPPADAPPAEGLPSDPTRTIDVSGAGIGHGSPYSPHDPAQRGQPSADPPWGSQPTPLGGAGPYSAPGYDGPGYGTPADPGQAADPGTFYGASGQPAGGYDAGYLAGGYPAGGYGGYPAGYPSGGQGASGYSASGYPQPPYVAAPPTNTMAVLAIIFAFVFSPLGVVFGIIARKQIKRTRESGDGLALAGIIVGGIFTALFVLFIVLPIIFLLAVGSAGSLG